MNDPAQLKEIARELSRLSATSPLDRSLLAAWYEEGQAFAARLDKEFAAVDLPEEVWHFLHDADIRAKDPRFRKAQIQMLGELIRDLENGIVPEPRGATFSLNPRWFLFAVLIAVGAIAVSFAM